MNGSESDSHLPCSGPLQYWGQGHHPCHDHAGSGRVHEQAWLGLGLGTIPALSCSNPKRVQADGSEGRVWRDPNLSPPQKKSTFMVPTQLADLLVV